MSDSKVFMFPEQSGNSTDALTLSLLSNGGMNSWANNPFMYLIWAYMMRWMNGGDYGNGQNCGTAMEAATQRQIQTLSD